MRPRPDRSAMSQTRRCRSEAGTKGTVVGWSPWEIVNQTGCEAWSWVLGSRKER